MLFQFRFESNPRTQGYVGVMANSPVYPGPVASQNAGSSDPGLYYRVDGGGLNAQFETALGPTLTLKINDWLKAAYDGRFGDGAYKNDSVLGRADRLTSFYVPMPAPLPSDAKVDPRAVAMVYSVGPHLQQQIVPTVRDAFRQVYVDALQAVGAAQSAAGAGAPRIALRLTLLSTGIYGGITHQTPPAVATALYRDVASLVLEAVPAAVKAAGAAAADLPTMLLVNADQSHGSGTGKEVDAFTHAAHALNLTVTSNGFDFDVV